MAERDEDPFDGLIRVAQQVLGLLEDSKAKAERRLEMRGPQIKRVKRALQVLTANTLPQRGKMPCGHWGREKEHAACKAAKALVPSADGATAAGVKG